MSEPWKVMWKSLFICRGQLKVCRKCTQSFGPWFENIPQCLEDTQLAPSLLHPLWPCNYLVLHRLIDWPCPSDFKGAHLSQVTTIILTRKWSTAVAISFELNPWEKGQLPEGPKVHGDVTCLSHFFSFDISSWSLLTWDLLEDKGTV
jgi:hypothetical protein